MKRSKKKWQKEMKLIKSRERKVLLWIASIIETFVMTLRGYYARGRRSMFRMRLKRIRALVNGRR